MLVSFSPADNARIDRLKRDRGISRAEIARIAGVSTELVHKNRGTFEDCSAIMLVVGKLEAGEIELPRRSRGGAVDTAPFASVPA
jgi:hypothetical protein